MGTSLQSQLIVCTVSMTDTTVLIQPCGSIHHHLSVFIAIHPESRTKICCLDQMQFCNVNTLEIYIAVTLFESFRCGNYH
jgi:hypothetical protein